MDITEVRVFVRNEEDKKLKAYAAVTFDNVFVVRNIKVIEGNNGLFIAMPSRRIKQSCPKCNFKNELRSKFCNHCGGQLPVSVTPTTDNDRQSEHKDIAHPITQEFRGQLQKKVLEAYEKEKAGSGGNLGLHNVS
ncbi:MAG TPA: hypothetical protein ENH41_05405 [Candidatus Omnitrophica bacterium]|nr:hypothetical protein [Candidatus Omnitrophota bacterium]